MKKNVKLLISNDAEELDRNELIPLTKSIKLPKINDGTILVQQNVQYAHGTRDTGTLCITIVPINVSS